MIPWNHKASLTMHMVSRFTLPDYDPLQEQQHKSLLHQLRYDQKASQHFFPYDLNNKWCLEHLMKNIPFLV